MEIFYLSLLTLIAATIGTITGFGTSTLMIPVLVIFIPVSFIGAQIAKKIVDRIPQNKFRTVVAVFLFAIGLKFILS